MKPNLKSRILFAKHAQPLDISPFFRPYPFQVHVFSVISSQPVLEQHRHFEKEETSPSSVGSTTASQSYLQRHTKANTILVQNE